jgi:hypothetical protein
MSAFSMIAGAATLKKVEKTFRRTIDKVEAYRRQHLAIFPEGHSMMPPLIERKLLEVKRSAEESLDNAVRKRRAFHRRCIEQEVTNDLADLQKRERWLRGHVTDLVYYCIDNLDEWSDDEDRENGDLDTWLGQMEEKGDFIYDHYKMLEEIIDEIKKEIEAVNICFNFILR